MSKTGRTQKKSDDKSKSDSYIWTDDRVELLLNVTNECKVSKTINNIDWTSGQSKYSDILERLLELYHQQGWSSVGSGATTPHQGKDSRLPQSETDKNILSSTFQAKALSLES